MTNLSKRKYEQLTPSQELIDTMLKISKRSLYQISKELNIQPTHLKKILDGKITRPHSKTFQKLIKNKYMK